MRSRTSPRATVFPHWEGAIVTAEVIERGSPSRCGGSSAGGGITPPIVPCGEGVGRGMTGSGYSNRRSEFPSGFTWLSGSGRCDDDASGRRFAAAEADAERVAPCCGLPAVPSGADSAVASPLEAVLRVGGAGGTVVAAFSEGPEATV